MKIRAISLCLFRHDGKVLVSYGFDSVKQEPFCRALGGGVDFGETSQDAAIREIKEELGADITDVEFLGVLESIFDYEGKLHHEIVFVYDASFVDKTLYQKPELEGREGNQTFIARWRSLNNLRIENPRLVPENVWTLL